MISKHQKGLYKKTFAKIQNITNNMVVTDSICEMLSTARKNEYNDDLKSFIYDNLTYQYSEQIADEDYGQFLLDRWIRIQSYGRGVTKEKMIYRYGESEGANRWVSYCEKQKISNTFEYKNEKFGWNIQQFEKYNSSRAVTLDNLIMRHGEDAGKDKWNEYCKKQAYVGCSKEYFIDKYGHNLGISKFLEVNKNKKLTLANFVRKYGEQSGADKFNKYQIKIAQGPQIMSRASQKFFLKLTNLIPIEKHDSLFFGTKNHEYFFNNSNMPNICFVDFYDLNTNKAIEFMGDYYHCNPSKYDKSFLNKTINLTAEQIWEKDLIRENMLKTEFGVSILNIWEGEVKTNESRVLKKCLEFLNYDNHF